MKQPSKAPCLNCEDRKVGCHSICDKYKTWKHELNEMRRRRDDDFTKYAQTFPLKQEQRAIKRKLEEWDGRR